MPDDSTRPDEPVGPAEGAAPPERDDDEILEVTAVDADTGQPVGGEPSPSGDAEGGDESRAEAERLRRDLDHLRDVYLRKLAEFDNFRKRTEREREELHRVAGENLVRELVPVLDNFERALQHREDTDPGSFRQGVEMIARQLWDVLERQGMERLDPSGQPFQPEYHEAVRRIEDPAQEPGTVAEVLAKGYLFGGRLVRPAMVGVVVEPSAVAPGREGEREGEERP